MSRSYYSVDKNLSYTVRGSAVLLNIASAKYGGDWHSVPHTHNHMELFYIISGKGQFLIGDELYPVNTNHLVIINPNVTHTEVSLNAQPLEYIVLGVSGIELSVGDSSNGQFCILDHFESLDISSCLRNILREMELKQPGYEDICQAYMEILIVQLMRDASFSGTSVSADPVNSRQCTMIRRYIDSHYKEPLTLDLLAEIATVNKYYLSHIYKEAYGISPISYMIACRIQEGKRLLADTDLSLSQISSILGFSSPSYFSQSFRKAEGISPVEYRKTHQQR